MDIGDQLPNKRSHLKASRYGSATNDDNDDIDPSPPQVGYQLSIIKCIVLVILAALPLFIGLLMAYWWRARWVKLTCFRCPLNVASIVIVKDLDGKERVERVQIAGTDCRYIEHRCLRYVYDPSEEVFTVLRGYDSGMTCEDMHGLAVGLSSSENAHFSYLGDKQYLYGDMVIILGFSFVMGITGSYPQLAKRRPPGTLAGIHVLFSLVIHVALAVSFQVAGIVYLHSRLWYEVGDFDSAASSENTVIFQFLMFQYIFLALALSTGPPYRKPIYTNIPFMVCLAVTVPCTTYLTLAPADWLPGLWSFMTMRPPPFFLFRVAIFEMILLYITLTYLLEAHVFHSEWWHTILRVIRFKRTPRNRYKHVLKSIDPQWPPLDEPCAETVQL
eukprot:Em0006g1431a